jgi:mRNA-degrading endonuclease YafQ of YafQ-DinJ toxin-antitoxin module
MKFGSISPEKKNTWSGKIIIEFDVDWSHEEVIDDTLSLLSQYSVETTWFATHDSPVLQNIVSDRLFEIGIHPNFVPLLKGLKTNGINYIDVIAKLKKIYPMAKVSKSHSLVDSSLILQGLRECGVTHENTLFIDNPEMRYHTPWRLWNGLVRVPLFWEDDYHTVSPYGENFTSYLKKNNGIRVFGFHPLHVFLNTESLDRYEQTKKFHQNPKELIKHRFKGYGTRNRLIELLNYTKQS